MFVRTLSKSLLMAGVSIVILTSAHGAGAQDQNPQPNTAITVTGATMTLREALARVVQANPTLLGQRFALSAADARRDQAALRPTIDVTGDVQDIFGTDRMAAFGQGQYTLQLSTVLELGGKRASRIATAERERDLLLTELDGEKIDIVAEVARRFIRVVAAQRELALADRSIALAGETRKAVTQRVNAGAGNPAELRNAEIAEARAQIERSRAESALNQSRLSLAALWAGDPAGPMDATAELFNLPRLEPLANLQTFLEQSPNLARFASERRVNESRVRLAETRAVPDMTVGAGVRRIQEMRSNAFVLNFTVPLGTASRAAPYAAEARSNLASVDFRERAARAELQATLASFYQEAQQREAELQQLRDRAVPLAENARELTQNGFNVGRFSLLELLNAQQQLITLQRAAIDASVAYHNALIEIERLTARPIISQTAN